MLFRIPQYFKMFFSIYKRGENSENKQAIVSTTKETYEVSSFQEQTNDSLPNFFALHCSPLSPFHSLVCLKPYQHLSM